ncbi:MAG: dihydrodipicolinate synthase family protein [Anaerovoracaceae bacterium]
MKHNLEKWGKTDLDGIVVLGSNGEFVYLTEAEKLEVIQFAVNNFTKAKKIIAGVSCESTAETIETAKKAAALGVDAVLVLPPHYYRGAMKDEILYGYFTDVADSSPVPVMLYNMPGNTGINLSSALIARLSNHPNIAGVKDTGGNIVQLAETVRDTDDNFSVFAGNTGYLMPALAVGARGAASSGQHIAAGMLRLVKLVRENRYEEAKALQLKLLKINTLVTGKYGFRPQSGYGHAGLRGRFPRKPLKPASEEARGKSRLNLKR